MHDHIPSLHIPSLQIPNLGASKPRSRAYRLIAVTLMLALGGYALCGNANYEELNRLVAANSHSLWGGSLTWNYEVSGHCGKMMGNLRAPISNVKGGPTYLHEQTDGFPYKASSYITIERGQDFDLVDVGFISMNMNNERADIRRTSMIYGPGLQATADRVTDLHGKEVSKLDTLSVVRVTAPGSLDSMSQNCCLTSTIDFRPEVAIFLAGASPLNLYGLKPDHVFQTAKGYDVQYRFSGWHPSSESTNRLPLNLDVYLTNRGIPVRLVRPGGKRNSIIITTHDSANTDNGKFAHFFTVESSSLVHEVREYSLASQEVKPIGPSSRSLQVIDWRLLKRNMSPNDFPPRGIPKTYTWKGRFPTLAELEHEPNIVWGGTPPAQPNTPSKAPMIAAAIGVIGMFGASAYLLRNRRKEKIIG